jgi:cobalt-zinc-cadmium efflux system outer membrane protein
MSRFALVAAAAAVIGVATPVPGQTVLTREEVIARARAQAGPVVVARARIAEAEADLVNASVRFRDNPVIDTFVGTRSAAARRSTDLELGVSQQFETGGQRRARIAGAEAAVDRQRAQADDAQRGAVLEALTAFLDAIAAQERLRLTEESETVSRELLNVTERRYTLGDIAAIDLNLARIDAARSSAALRGARVDFTDAIGRLRMLLRLPSGPLEVRGTLDLPAPAGLDVLRSAVLERADFVTLRAEAREAEAQIQLGRALRRPDLGLRVGYEREETDDIVLGGLTIALPAFQRGQGTMAAGAARAARARLQLETVQQAAIADMETAYAVYQQHATLAGTLEAEAAPGLDDNQNLARRSYEAGELSLIEFLLIRRDALETRMTIVDRRLDAARSRLAIDYLSGLLP